ncbi:FMN-dependent NADH-azoreductase [Roseicitreum antarcticum]|uniref:FMN dependent NADH:quinone oxidoreductase n=1 Tax=Roseicitreum antarcticum TaxID=564137 RepID=A0A1H2RUM4_9RHOB|nr:NAD(P)H-dependent oxidoreductase [Roseicitreum antarcticum]SDW22978.1 FMN-dependent NADH-azoreductase [Roseicitreum antarcticum]
MTHVLRLDATIKSDGSVSKQLTDRISERFSKAGAAITSRDLSAGISMIDGAWMGAVFTPADQRSAEQAKIAAESDAYLAELQAADVILLGLPIYNFAVPAQVKSWFDHVARQGVTFEYTETGPRGLLSGKRAIVAMSSGGTTLGSDIDFASGWVRHMFGFMGITDVEFIAADNMAVAAEESLHAAFDAADKLAA